MYTQQKEADMQYTKLGKSGLIVSKLACGTMTFGQGTLVADWKTNIDQKAANEIVNTALDAGINFFDTADMYTNGQSEIMLGKALKNKRTSTIIATKCGFRSGEAITDTGLSYRYILQSVQTSLQRLNTDYIDLFLLHIPDPFTRLEESAKALEAVIQKGWVRYVGFCNYPSWKAQKLMGIQEKSGFSKCITSQMYYSLLGRDIEHDVVPFLQESNLGLMVWSPLASGFLAGKYTRENPIPKDSRRAKFDFPPVDVEKGYEVVDLLNKIAEKHRATIPQIAISWLLAKPYVSTVLIGASKIDQLQDNLGAANIILDDNDIENLDKLTEIAPLYPAWMQPMGWDQKVREALGK